LGRGLMPGLNMDSELKVEVPSFCGTVLPLAANAVYGNEDCLDAIVAIEPMAQYDCLLDAVVARLVPGMRSRVLGYYAGHGQPLRDLWPTRRIDTLDAALARAIDACAEIATQVALPTGDPELMRQIVCEAFRSH
jgi:hypothetical protein